MAMCAQDACAGLFSAIISLLEAFSLRPWFLPDQQYKGGKGKGRAGNGSNGAGSTSVVRLFLHCLGLFVGLFREMLLF